MDNRLFSRCERRVVVSRKAVSASRTVAFAFPMRAAKSVKSC